MILGQGELIMTDIQIRNNIKIIGNGEKTILFAHGFGCNQKMWQYLLSHFGEEYRLILFDYVGSGSSDINAYTTEKYRNLEGYKQDVFDIIDALQLQNLIFIGHSISSMIGMLAAIEEPQHFSKLIMIGPSPCYINDGNYNGGFEEKDIEELLEMMEMNFSGWASYLAPVAMDAPKDSPLTQELETAFVSVNPRIAREFAEATFYCDYRNKVKNLQVPTLIVQCSNDSIVPIEVGQFLYKQIENSELVIMDVRGHYPHISRPTETAEIIKHYLSQE